MYYLTVRAVHARTDGTFYSETFVWTEANMREGTRAFFTRRGRTSLYTCEQWDMVKTLAD